MVGITSGAEVAIMQEEKGGVQYLIMYPISTVVVGVIGSKGGGGGSADGVAAEQVDQ